MEISEFTQKRNELENKISQFLTKEIWGFVGSTDVRLKSMSAGINISTYLTEDGKVHFTRADFELETII